MTRKNMTKTPRSPRRRVEFIVEDAPGRDIAIAGSFNGWACDRKMVDKNGDGVYRCIMQLEPGTYEYKFVVDGEWKLDERNPNFAPNSLGSLNSVLVVDVK